MKKSRRSPFFPVVIHTHVLELCLPKNAKLSLRKDPPFGLAVLVGRIAKPSLSAVMLADDGIMQAAKV